MPAIELAVISVAGIGSRLGLNIPKGLVTISGETLLQRQLDLVRDIPQVRIVVGFKEEEVVEHVRHIRDDVIFVRNRNYDRTSLLQSMYLAIRSWHGPFLALEGDVIFEPTAFGEFLKKATTPGFLAVTATTTDDALCAATSTDASGNLWVDGFQRQPRSQYEWSGLGTMHSSWIEDRNAFAYEALLPHLPMQAMVVPSFEVDTPSDLDRAHHVLRNGNWDPTTDASSDGQGFSLMDNRPSTTTFPS